MRSKQNKILPYASDYVLYKITGMFIIHNFLSDITSKWKSKYKFCAVTFQFYIVHKNYLNKSCIFFKDLSSYKFLYMCTVQLCMMMPGTLILL
jgi:hypothetical protein